MCRLTSLLLSVTARRSRVMSSKSFFIFHCVVKPPRFTCVSVCSPVCVQSVFVCVRACVHVRAFMHQPGNCRCWFVCIQGSACSRSQDSFLKAISSSKVSSSNSLSSAKTLSFKTFIFNISSFKISSTKKGCLCIFNSMCALEMALR